MVPKDQRWVFPASLSSDYNLMDKIQYVISSQIMPLQPPHSKKDYMRCRYPGMNFSSIWPAETVYIIDTENYILYVSAFGNQAINCV